MPADMIERFLASAVLINRPGEELIEFVAEQSGSGEQIGTHTPRLGVNLRLIRGGDRTGGLIAPIERAVSNRSIKEIGVRLLIALQVVPSTKYNPACGID